MRVVSRKVRNFSDRNPDAEIDCIVIHATGPGTVDGALAWWSRTESQASAHYLIERGGLIYLAVDPKHKAWHAGVSSFQGVPNVNQYSIGVELQSSAGEYSKEQIDALVELTCHLIKEYPAIRMDRITGHADVALPKGRKVDPQGFPWAGYRAKVRWKLTELGL